MIFPGLIVPYCYRNIKKPSCSFFILANAILAHNSSANARWGKKEKKKKDTCRLSGSIKSCPNKKLFSTLGFYVANANSETH